MASYFLVSYGKHPLLWFSANDSATFSIYERLFANLGIEDDVRRLVDHRDHVQLYSAFLVVCDRAPQPMWHLDYLPGANAYTLITPLHELGTAHGHLVYRPPSAERQTLRYEYRLGHGIILGDHFPHSTEPFPPAGQLRVLLSMTFGTDKVEYWPVLRETLGKQARFLILPCGHRYGSCQCVSRWPARRERRAPPGVS